MKTSIHRRSKGSRTKHPMTNTREPPSLTRGATSTATRQRDRRRKSVLGPLKHAPEHGSIAPARASECAHEPEERRFAQARVPRQFEEARKERFERLERPFAVGVECIIAVGEEGIVMAMMRGGQGVGATTLLVVVVVIMILGGGDGSGTVW